MPQRGPHPPPGLGWPGMRVGRGGGSPPQLSRSATGPLPDGISTILDSVPQDWPHDLVPEQSEFEHEISTWRWQSYKSSVSPSEHQAPCGSACGRGRTLALSPWSEPPCHLGSLWTQRGRHSKNTQLVPSNAVQPGTCCSPRLFCTRWCGHTRSHIHTHVCTATHTCAQPQVHTRMHRCTHTLRAFPLALQESSEPGASVG